MSRRPLLTVFAVSCIALAACGGTETTADVVAPSPGTTTAPVTAPITPTPATDTTETTSPAEDEGPGTDTPPAPAPAAPVVQPVSLTFDGREVPVAHACTGADGAFLATTEGEVTITLVREEGVALRYAAEGTGAETDEVTVGDGTDATTYRATLSSDDVAPVEVTMVVMDDAMAALETC